MKRAVALLAVLLLAGAIFWWFRRPGDQRFSQLYTVELAEGRYRILKTRDEDAGTLDRDKDGNLSRAELKVWGSKMPGGLLVDLDDYSEGLAYTFAGRPLPYYDTYLSLEQLESQLRAMAKAHPDLMSVVELGKSAEGRSIWGVRVGQGGPKIVVVAQQHAREWLAHRAAMALLESLPSSNLKGVEFWVVPMANPDGYEYSRTLDMGWRKNRRVTGPGRQEGVDLNRNYPADFRRKGDRPAVFKDDWGGSDLPRSHIFRGDEPGSEPETRCLQSLVKREGVVAVIDLHAFGCKLIIPNAPTVAPEATYQGVGKAMLAELGSDYTLLRFGEMYPITGSLGGWADQQGRLGLNIELGKALQPSPDKAKVAEDAATRGVLACARYLLAHPMKAR